MMTILWNLSTCQLAWLPGDPARRALLLHTAAWFLIGGALALLIALGSGREAAASFSAALDLGGIGALGPGLYGGLYWRLNHKG